MISYPEEHRRGFYISLWVVMRNLGSIIAGAITFGLNIASDGKGGVTTNTYLVFLGMECIGRFTVLDESAHDCSWTHRPSGSISHDQFQEDRPIGRLGRASAS